MQEQASRSCLQVREPSFSLFLCPACLQYDCTQLTCYCTPAQLCGLSFGLSIAGAIFLNFAQNALKGLLPDTPLSQIQQIISGTSGGFLQTLAPDLREKALGLIVAAWQKMYALYLSSARSCLHCATPFKC